MNKPSIEALATSAAADIAKLRQTHDPSRPRYRTSGRRGMRYLERGRLSKRVPAIGPGNLTRAYRRALASIMRTESDPARAFAKRLGDPIGMYPLAVSIIEHEFRGFA